MIGEILRKIRRDAINDSEIKSTVDVIAGFPFYFSDLFLFDFAYLLAFNLLTETILSGTKLEIVKRHLLIIFTGERRESFLFDLVVIATNEDSIETCGRWEFFFFFAKNILKNRIEGTE